MPSKENTSLFEIHLFFPDSLNDFSKKYLGDGVDVKNDAKSAKREFGIISQNNERIADDDGFELSPEVSAQFLEVSRKYEQMYGSPDSESSGFEENYPVLRELIKYLGFEGETPDRLLSSLDDAKKIHALVRKNVDNKDFDLFEAVTEEGEGAVDLLVEAEKIQRIFLETAKIIDGISSMDPIGLSEARVIFRTEFVDFTEELVYQLRALAVEKSKSAAGKEASRDFTEEAEKSKENTSDAVLDVNKILSLEPESEVNEVGPSGGAAKKITVYPQRKEVVSQLEKNFPGETPEMPRKTINSKIKFLEKSVGNVRAILDKNNEELKKIQKKKENQPDTITGEDTKKELFLSSKISQLSTLSSVINTLLEDLFAEKGNLEGNVELSSSKESDLEMVAAIYERLKDNFVPSNSNYKLPDFESFLNPEITPPTKAYGLLTGAIMARIDKFYEQELASGSSVFAFQSKSIDMWSNDKMFDISLTGSDDNSTFQFLIENFPWEKMLPSSERTPNNIIDLKKEMISFWKFRIIAIQNASNAAFGVESTWRDQEHTGYHDQIFTHISQKGAGGGGNQGWDLKPYYTRTHKGETNGSRLMAEITGEEEKSWLLPAYENYFLHAVQEKYHDLHLNQTDPGGPLDQLKNDLINGGDETTIRGILEKQIVEKYGKERLEQDTEMLNLAYLKAIWTLVHTLKLHEFDKGGIQSRLGRYNVKDYFAKVFNTGVSGVQWRPGIASTVKRALLPFETVNTLDLRLVDDSGNPIYDELSDFNFGSNDKSYQRWIDDLIEKSLDNYTNISNVEHIEWLKNEQTILQGIACSDNKLKETVRKRISLKKKIEDWKNYGTGADGDYREGRRHKKASKKLRDKDISDLLKMQKSIDANKDLNHLSGLLVKLDEELRGKRDLPVAGQNMIVARTAVTYAIKSRYKVIEIKKENTEFGLEDRLPIAIPLQRLEFEDLGDKGLVPITAVQMPVQVVRDSQINTSEYVMWENMSKNPNTAWVAFSLELKRWFKMLDLQDHDAIFVSVHAQRLQEKIMARISPFEDVKNIQFDFLRGRIFSLIFKNNEEKVFKIGKELDELLREKILITDIPLSELVSESDDENEKPPGFGFTVIAQYAAKYLFGKMPNKALFLEIFRQRVSDLDETIAKHSFTPAGTVKREFLADIATPVPSALRNMVDEVLDAEKELKERRKKNPEAKGYPTRSENETILELFWMSIDGYLDQYAYSDHVAENLDIPLRRADRAQLMKAVETVSGDHPMNFADRALFIAYVKKMLEYFESPAFAIGEDAPRNIGSVADILVMMEKKRIIGSSMQILADMKYKEEGFVDLIKKEEAEKK